MSNTTYSGARSVVFVSPEALPPGRGMTPPREALCRELMRDLLATTPGVVSARPALRHGRPGVRLVVAA